MHSVCGEQNPASDLGITPGEAPKLESVATAVVLGTIEDLWSTIEDQDDVDEALRSGVQSKVLDDDGGRS